jgi:predicted flap endonuclease-1-like 5' DNA nuclease
VEDAPAAETASDAPETADSVIQPSKPLPGQEELAQKKGDWSYTAPEGDKAPEADTAAPAAEAPAEPAPTPEPAAADKGEDYDKDGKLEGTDEGTKPQTLDAPRGGQADNLKEIKGVGPKLEQVCFSMGFYHFDQIAAWTEDEIAWVNANLIGFKGRVTRDKWVEQAKVLAEGGETEFSKRVDQGKVY